MMKNGKADKIQGRFAILQCISAISFGIGSAFLFYEGNSISGWLSATASICMAIGMAESLYRTYKKRNKRKQEGHK